VNELLLVHQPLYQDEVNPFITSNNVIINKKQKKTANIAGGNISNKNKKTICPMTTMAIKAIKEGNFLKLIIIT
jgi:hypothetical protein